MFDLEVWLMGTPAELDAAMTALRAIGRIGGASKPERLYGADAGRVRRYLHVSVPIPATHPRPARPARPAA